MREYLDLIQILSEAAVGMSANEIKKYDWRFQKFIEYIAKRKPFTKIDGNEVIADPREAKRFQQLFDNGQFGGALKIRLSDGEEIPLSQLAKTGDFGGAAVAAGQDASQAGKEGLIVKPSQIGICDKNIPAEDLYEVIESNAALASTEYGQVVQLLAKMIVSGDAVVLPPDYQGKEKEKVRKAIVDYAGEYLGVLALIYNRSRFPRKAEFQKWMGADTNQLTVNFPLKANTNLADSYATVTNSATNHTLNISSKGTGGGAAPAISGLKVPDYIRQDPNYESAIKFIDICQKLGTVPQAFAAMDLIFEVNPSAINKKWHKFLPFAVKSPKLAMQAKESLDLKKQRVDQPLPSKYHSMFNDIDSPTASDGGKLIYCIKREVADAMNSKDAIPEFKNAIIQILEMNFIQQYCDYKGGQMTFATQWPAKLDGKISVENKSSAIDPTAGGFSFKLGRTDDSVSSEPGEEPVDGMENEPDLATAAKDIAEPKSQKEKESGQRKKRK